MSETYSIYLHYTRPRNILIRQWRHYPFGLYQEPECPRCTQPPPHIGEISLYTPLRNIASIHTTTPHVFVRSIQFKIKKKKADA